MNSPDLNADSLAYVERLYAAFLEEPSRVPDTWRRYFDALDGDTVARFAPSFRPRSLFDPAATGVPRQPTAKSSWLACRNASTS